MNKKIIIVFLMIITMASTDCYYGRGGWGWGYGIGLGYGLGWGYPYWGWGYPGWGWGWGYPYYGYNNARAEENARYYADRAERASLRAQQAEERLAKINRRKNLRRRNQNMHKAPPGYPVKFSKY